MINSYYTQKPNKINPIRADTDGTLFTQPIKEVKKMFEILKNKTICLTRGDIAKIVFTPKIKSTGQSYVFKQGDIIRFTVTKQNDYSNVVIQKDIKIEESAENVIITLDSEDTRFGKPNNSPVDYWYEIELNPDTEPQTLIGHDKDGAKVFRLFPEGGKLNG